jgi:putative protease
MKEERIGTVSNYYKKIGVIAATLDGNLAVGNTIHIKGNITDFLQKVESMQIEHKNIEQAKKGDDVGIRVKEYTRVHDVIYRVIEEG